jgi:hypothetical protein
MSGNLNLSYGPMDDLRQALPYIAGLLSKSAAGGKVSDLAIISAEHLPRRYMRDEACRDTVISKHGLLSNGNFPFVLTEREDEYEGRIPGWGVTIYECRRDRRPKDKDAPGLRYAVYCLPDRHAFRDDFRCYVVLKDEEKTFRDHVRHQEAKANRITKAPILRPGMLEQIVDSTIGYLDRRANIERYGVRIVRGILLEGDPGNGKTMVCRWLRKLCIERDITWGQVTAGQIENWHHNGNPLFELFNSSIVTFFDDFNMELLTGDMGRDIVSALDGIEDTAHRIRIFTTNQKVKKEVDPAFFRPGRVDERFAFGNPDREMRERLVNMVWPHEIAEWINNPGRMAVFLDKSKDFSFADLEAIRKNMVFEHEVTGEWDQDKAFARFAELRVEQRNPVGFAPPAGYKVKGVQKKERE